MIDPDFPYLNEFQRISFPKESEASEEGIVATGANLSPGVLLSAYSQGVFPWYNDISEPILWWNPDPRCVLFPEKLHVSKRMERKLRTDTFIIKSDTCFREVITNCAKIKRRHQQGTWINTEIIESYLKLHNMGWAHSVEAFTRCKEGEMHLSGGLYGVSLGRCFFGESMFSRVTDASKAAFITMVRTLQKWGIRLIDCQILNQHLLSLGAENVSREQYLNDMQRLIKYPDFKGKWQINR